MIFTFAIFLRFYYLLYSQLLLFLLVIFPCKLGIISIIIFSLLEELESQFNLLLCYINKFLYVLAVNLSFFFDKLELCYIYIYIYIYR